jgi:hypothetical protein
MILERCIAFCCFHLATIVATFISSRVLLEKYGPSLARHSQLKDYAAVIGDFRLRRCDVLRVTFMYPAAHLIGAGQMYFNIPTRRPFASLFGA